MSIWLSLVAVVAFLVWGLSRILAGYPRSDACSLLTRQESAFVIAAGDATFPPGGAIPYSGSDAGTAGYVDRWLAVLHPRMRLLMRMLFFLVEHATLFFPAPGGRGFRRFSSLSLEQRAVVLDGWRTSRWYARRLVFTSLRAILTMGYFAHPPVLRALGVAPLDIASPVCEADLLYPPIGAPPSAVRYSRADLTPPSDGTPVDLAGPLHPDFAERSP